MGHVSQTAQTPPPPFLAALDSLRRRELSEHITLQEVPAPKKIAPYALALTGDVDEFTASQRASAGGTFGAELASGRFVVLYDPSGQEEWDGEFRVVTLVRATLEADVGSDALLGQVGWTWVTEALELNGAEYREAGGTSTRVFSESYGTLSDRTPTTDFEIRASWTANSPDLAPHINAWGSVLVTLAGLPPVGPSVTMLSRKRSS